MPRGLSRISGWGGMSAPGRERVGEDLAALTRGAVLTRGLGRSYGDSALPPDGVDSLAGSALADRILDFDEATGRLRAEAGLSLAAINRTFWRRHWTCPVLPGTQFVTLGGMVAADVHGKNHHVDGTIGRHVERLRLRLADDRLVHCSRDEHPDLFRATLGGMGLTGHILEVTLRLQRIPTPWIWCESERVRGLDGFLAGLATAARLWPFTVGWLDALVGGGRLGRGILYRGRWAAAGEAPAAPPKPLGEKSIPFTFPGWVLNRLSMRTFNALYFRRHPSRRRGIVHPEQFFHPLDAIRHWNRIYGRRGFTQHQCVLPENERPGATRRFLEELTRRGGASFLCVIKDCGPQGEGLLSFPRSGISIAVDLPVRPGLQELIDALNERVLAEDGRIYLAKDGYTRREHFRAMEGERLTAFAAARRVLDPAGKLASAQSRRLLE